MLGREVMIEWRADAVCPHRFLLKYTSRDTVTLLRRGTGGVVETRRAIEQYGEQSPLYGLIQYRRKKFILKYVPEGISRLLQGRAINPVLTATVG